MDARLHRRRGGVRAGVTSRCLLAGALLAYAFGGAALAVASTPTVFDVADAFTDAAPFQARVALRDTYERQSERIARELLCDQDPLVCPGERRILLSSELEGLRERHALLADIRLGLARDLELHVELPIVLSDQTRLDFAAGVGPENSRVDGVLVGGLQPDGRVGLPQVALARKGLGDITFGLRYAPLSAERGPALPFLVFDIAYTAPTAPAMRADNDAVGEGLHQLRLAGDAGAPVTRWFIPYAGVDALLRFTADDELYVSGFRTQRYDRPGAQLGMRVGASFIPWADAEGDRNVRIVLEGGGRWIGAGREPTLLFAGLGLSPCSAAGSGCDQTRYPAAEGTPNPTTTNGVTDVEGRAVLGGQARLAWRPHRFVEVSLGFELAVTQAHYLTNARVGRDLDGSFSVDRLNTRGESEISPVFAPGLDEPGQRFRAREVLDLGVNAGVQGRF